MFKNNPTCFTLVVLFIFQVINLKEEGTTLRFFNFFKRGNFKEENIQKVNHLFLRLILVPKQTRPYWFLVYI